MSESVDRAERLRKAIGDFVRATRADADALPASQAATLGFLARDGDATIAQLARWRGIRHQSMRIAVEDLERRGAVERRRDPNDARSFLIRLTELGKSTLELERGRRAASISSAMERALTPAEQKKLDTLSGLLERLTSSITSHSTQQ